MGSAAAWTMTVMSAGCRRGGALNGPGAAIVVVEVEIQSGSGPAVVRQHRDGSALHVASASVDQQLVFKPACRQLQSPRTVSIRGHALYEELFSKLLSVLTQIGIWTSLRPRILFVWDFAMEIW